MGGRFNICFAILTLALRASADVVNSMYIISNAEDLSIGRVGLTVVGEERATTCLPSVRRFYLYIAVVY